MDMHFVVLDFEFREVAPGRLEVVCVVAIDLATGQVFRVWLEGDYPSSSRFPCGSDTDFRDDLDEVDELAGFFPEIVEKVEKDLDTHGLNPAALQLAEETATGWLGPKIEIQ
jgi:hypothetical protein